MPSVLVSSKGQIVLPAALRRRLGLGAGTRLEVLEEADGIKLTVSRAVPIGDVAQMAGMVKAASGGTPRSLADFDPATLMNRASGRKP